MRKVKDVKTKYVVLYVRKTFLSTSGRCALTEHARKNNHIKNVTKRDNFFKPLTKHNEKYSSEKQCSHQSSSSVQQPSTLTQQTLNSNIETKSAVYTPCLLTRALMK